MTEEFQFDVFLSHSSKDKSVVRELAARLEADGIRVWLDEEQIKPGDSIPAKIEEGLEHSRVLLLCMSANAFGSDWAQLESGTFRFRDPLNKERRFIPLRLDDTPPNGSLAQFLYIDWRLQKRESEYPNLVAACQPPTGSGTVNASGLATFLKDRIEREFEQLDREKITPWIFLTSHGVSLEGPGGRRWSYHGVRFEGSPREVFWNDFLEHFIRDITSRSFDEVRSFCERRGMDIPSAIAHTAHLLKVGVAQSLNRMVEVDQRLQGGGFPGLIHPIDASEKFVALTGIIDRGLAVEVATQQQPCGIKAEPVKTVRPLVVLVHGIRTGGRWIKRIKPILEKEADCVAEPAGYGFLDVFRFLLPRPFRSGAIETVRWKLQHAIDRNRERPLIIIAHSFGTYCVTEILKDCPQIRPARMLFCGSIVAQDFRWDSLRQMDQVQGLFVLNECGARDIWPPLAHSMTFGYGASGTGGFQVAGVEDRHHDLPHSGYFTIDFIRRFWVPFVKGGTVARSDFEAEMPESPWWISAIGLRPILPWFVLFPLLSAAVSFLLLWPKPQTDSKQAGLDGFVHRYIISAEPGTTNSLIFAEMSVDNLGGAPSSAKEFGLKVFLSKDSSTNAEVLRFPDEYRLNFFHQGKPWLLKLKRPQLISEKTIKAIPVGESPRGWVAFRLFGIPPNHVQATNGFVVSFWDIADNKVAVTNGIRKGKLLSHHPIDDLSVVEPGGERIFYPIEPPARTDWLPPELPAGCSNVVVFFGTHGLITSRAVAEISSVGKKFAIAELPDFLSKDLEKLPNYSPRQREIWFRTAGAKFTIGDKVVDYPIQPVVISNRLYVELEIPFSNEKRKLVMSDAFSSELPIPLNWDVNFSTNYDAYGSGIYAYEVVNELTNPVLQVFYTAPNEVHVNGIFQVESNSILAAFGDQPILGTLTFSPLDPNTGLVEASLKIENFYEVLTIRSNETIASFGQRFTNEFFRPIFKNQRPVFKYPSNRNLGAFADELSDDSK